MSKSQDAFRTISEVSDALDTPAHVLRFWESKFAQVKPVKRAGGRRYYRPSDVDLLAGIKQLLHVDGMTIKGAQKLLREQGVRQVTAIGAAIMGSVEEAKAAQDRHAAEPVVEHQPQTPEQRTVQAAVDANMQSGAPTTPQEQRTSGNIVPLQAAPEEAPSPTTEGEPAPDDPAASDNNAAEPAPAEAPAAAMLPDIPADPEDNNSKATARMFHLLRRAPPEALYARSDEIAPLLARMRDLRGRISLR